MQGLLVGVLQCKVKVSALPHASLQNHVACGIAPLGGSCAFQPKYNHKHQGANLKQLHFTHKLVNHTSMCLSMYLKGFSLAPCKFAEPCSLWHSTMGGNCAFQPKYNHKHQGANLKQLHFFSPINWQSTLSGVC
jgi:hypothetical protein